MPQLIELRATGVKLPPRMIEILLAAACITTCGLNVASLGRADPDMGPGWRNNKLIDPLKDSLIADRIPRFIDIDKAAPLANTSPAGRFVSCVTESRLAGYFARLRKSSGNHSSGVRITQCRT